MYLIGLKAIKVSLLKDNYWGALQGAGIEVEAQIIDVGQSQRQSQDPPDPWRSAMFGNWTI